VTAGTAGAAGETRVLARVTMVQVATTAAVATSATATGVQETNASGSGWRLNYGSLNAASS